MRDDAEPNLITLCASCHQDVLEEKAAQNSAETSIPCSLCKGSEQRKAIEGSHILELPSQVVVVFDFRFARPGQMPGTV